MMCSIPRGVVPLTVLAALLLPLSVPAQLVPPLAITSRTIPVGTAGIEYSETLSAAGGRAPYRWILVNGGTSGVSLSSAGRLSVSEGRATAGRWNVVVQVRDADNRVSTTTLLLVINAKPEILPETLQPIVTGAVAQIVFRVVGGTDASVPRLSRGAFPPGFILQNGTLRGTPAAAGTFNFTLASSDANGAVATRDYTLQVIDPLKITSLATLPSGSVGAPYSFTLKASGGAGPIRWALANGSLPTWLALSQDGLLRGTPPATGNYNFTVSATDAGSSGSKAVTQIVSLSVGSLLTISTMSPLPPGRQGSLYVATLRASGGVPPLEWSMTSGGLPEGVTLSPSGELRGVPGVAGTFGFGAKVTDAGGRTASRAYSVKIAPAEDKVTADLIPDFIRFQVIELGLPEVKSVQVVSSSLNPAEYTTMVEYFGRGNGWLTLPRSVTTSAGATGFLRLEASPTNLAPGTYQARVLVQGPGFDNPAALPVNMVVSRGSRTLSATPQGVTFVATEGGPAPPPKTISVLNGGVGSLVWNATATTISGSSTWLSIRNQTGSSETGHVPGVITLAANPAGLTAGEYYGVVNVESSMVSGGPQAMTVVMQVRPADAPAEVDVEPLGMVVTNQPQEIRLTNTGLEPVTFYASPGVTDGSHGFEFSPSTGILEPGIPVPVTVRANQSLGFGVRRSLLNFSFSNDRSKGVDISVVSAAAGTNASATGSFRTMAVVSATCTPTQLVPVSTLFGSNFTVPAGWPTPIEVRVVNDCGAPVTAGTVTVAFSNGDPPLSLTPLGEGRWSGTWTGRNAITPQVTITITAEESSTGLKGSYQTTGGVQANPDPPIVAHGGIVNAASFAARSPLAPGTLVSIFGSRLATAPITANSLPLDTTLGVTTVTLGGRLLPLLYAADGQVNAVVPFDVPLDVPQGLLIRRGTSLSVPETIVVTDAQPGVFTKDRSGRGQGLVVDANARLVEAGNAARQGQSVSIFATGLGTVTPQVSAAEAAPANPLASARGTVRVTIGGRPAEVLWAGLVPGFTGLYQVNIVVPPGAPSGDNIPVIVSTDDTVSPPVSIAVQQ